MSSHPSSNSNPRLGSLAISPKLFTELLNLPAPNIAIAGQVLFGMALTASFLVFILYWTLLAPFSKTFPPPNPSSYLTHGVNFFVMLLDARFSAIQFPLSQAFYYTLIIPILWAIWSLIAFAAELERPCDCLVGAKYDEKRARREASPLYTLDNEDDYPSGCRPMNVEEFESFHHGKNGLSYDDRKNAEESELCNYYYGVINWSNLASTLIYAFAVVFVVMPLTACLFWGIILSRRAKSENYEVDILKKTITTGTKSRNGPKAEQSEAVAAATIGDSTQNIDENRNKDSGQDATQITNDSQIQVTIDNSPLGQQQDDDIQIKEGQHNTTLTDKNRDTESDLGYANHNAKSQNLKEGDHSGQVSDTDVSVTTLDFHRSNRLRTYTTLCKKQWCKDTAAFRLKSTFTRAHWIDTWAHTKRLDANMAGILASIFRFLFPYIGVLSSEDSKIYEESEDIVISAINDEISPLRTAWKRYLIFRVFLLVIMLFILVISLAIFEWQSQYYIWFYFLTHWALMIEIIYLSVAVISTQAAQKALIEKMSDSGKDKYEA